MHMIFRTLWHMWVAGPRGRRISMHEVTRSRFRVWPTDLDLLWHMNNGKFLSIMDIARVDLIQRAGILKIFKREGWYPVVVGQTISYRKSLTPWRRFWIESRILGFDDRAVYLEQRFVRPDARRQPEIYAQAYVRARILRRSGGTVSVADLIERTGADPSKLHVPEEILEWGRVTKLPATRAEAPSVWLSYSDELPERPKQA